MKHKIKKMKQCCFKRWHILIFVGLVVLSSAYIAFMTGGEDMTLTSTIEINDLTTNGPSLEDSGFYGRGFDDVGDLDGDGVNDWIVGVPGENYGYTSAGRAYIHFMNSDQSIKSVESIDYRTSNGPTDLEAYSNYGASVVGLGDLDGDGVGDVAISAPVSSSIQTLPAFKVAKYGSVYIHLLNADGSVKSTTKYTNETVNGATLSSGAEYGISLANIGDLNGDGVTDLLVGAYLDEDVNGAQGVAFIHFLNSDASIASTAVLDRTTTNGAPFTLNSDYYGFAVGALGDVNGDTVKDIAIGAYGIDGNGTDRGKVYIHFMNTDGTVIDTTIIDEDTANAPTLVDESYFGSYLAGLNDLDGDGVEDMIVGAKCNDGSSCKGKVHVLFLDTDGSIKSSFTIDDSTTNGPTLSDNDYYGGEVASVGDLNGDGYTDIVVGAIGDDAGGTSRGALHISYVDIAQSSSTSDTVVHPRLTHFDLADEDACYSSGDPVDFIFDGKNIDQFVVADNKLFQEAYWEPVFSLPSTSSWTFNESGVQTIYALFKNNNGNRTPVQRLEVVVNESCIENAPVLPEGIEPGDVIRMFDDGDESTQDDVTVYYIDFAGNKRPFLNEDLFFSWFDSFDIVKFVEPVIVRVIPKGDPILYKPGSLVKYPNSSEVYFVDTNYILRHLETERVAGSMFGDRWAAYIFDIPHGLPLYFEIGRSVAGYNKKLLESVQNVIIE